MGKLIAREICGKIRKSRYAVMWRHNLPSWRHCQTLYDVRSIVLSSFVFGPSLELIAQFFTGVTLGFRWPQFYKNLTINLVPRFLTPLVLSRLWYMIWHMKFGWNVSYMIRIKVRKFGIQEKNHYYDICENVEGGHIDPPPSPPCLMGLK